jgi:hypothetical protein
MYSPLRISILSNPQRIDTSQYASFVDVYRSGDTWTIMADPGSPPGPGDVAAGLGFRRDWD